MPAAAAMVSMSSEPPYYDGPAKKSSGKFLTHFARRLRIGKGSKAKPSVGVGANGLLEMDSEEDRQGVVDGEEIVILRHGVAPMPDELLTGGSSGAESGTMVLVVPAAAVVTAPPFKRGHSFRQSLSYLLKRTRPKLTERSCTSDSDVVHELDEDAATVRKGKRPVLDVFMPEQVPAKRHSTGDIFNEDLDANIRAQELTGTGGRHRRVHSDTTSYGLTGKTSTKAGQPKSANSVGLGTRPLPLSSTIEPLSSVETSGGQPEGAAHLNVLSRSPSHSTAKSDPKSLKSLSPSARSSTIRSSSPHPLKSFSSTRDAVDKPEKHHKKKEGGMSWEQKKFAQHFAQVPDDEVVLDYFSCALVGDILLQGYLYITQHYFAFYSNVFGYVTKLLIPTVSVLDISREKTAYMFPNAVGVKTRDDRHVFGSFLSREAAYYLMCSVWERATTPHSDSLGSIQHTRLAPLHAEGSEGSLDEDSSCYDGMESSFHGKDDMPDLLDSGDSNEKRELLNATEAGTNQSSDDSTVQQKQKKLKKELLLKSPAIVKSPAILKVAVAAGALEGLKGEKTLPMLAGGLIGDGPGAISGGGGARAIYGDGAERSKLSLVKRKLRHILPSDFGIIHIGLILAVLMTLFSCFLAYKIHALQARLAAPPIRLGDDTDFYLDVLRWQKRLHSKSKEEAQIVLNSNLEQIIKVRKSLETLSLLIKDTATDGSGDGRDEDRTLLGAIMGADGARVLADGGSLNQQYFHEDAT
ncbi:GRAM domain-containing protein 2B-like isoform X1 [Anopheles stephensi]|uniref:GRAM domain-containing protein 2B-like isoform X1 n=1 Tax=Anopheles stephensi TaxID=30069 RepID=UPI0016589D42|nr:GRAM domain-containing protein 2B-like isoform X1 [Anopheles stephensi]XP_035896205.1 GRAM domain-containing protein 2B-like isoform X1 [Anopheles stephensi]XP_035896207.1 GRAM domain-containing protein 2B-like isoform X1 [Anopheles stephensi]XP_035896208.1 GRAM domain-containing protein 2B-like isoform X1 [Anopheles stephensi]XP_035896209.1 GRAM domain-containing protein 2B-like isoform X1 [Anopheles stephensi]XP_035896210.1 GRAM domain-containing protein 2B-like isoform X1 [Anopheles step